MNNFWNDNVKEIEAMWNTQDKNNFLRWPVIQNTMFVDNPSWIDFEFDEVIGDEDYKKYLNEPLNN